MDHRYRLFSRSSLYAFALLLLLWNFCSWIANSYVLPTPWASFARFFEQLPQGLGIHLAISAARILFSLMCALLLALPLGLVAGFNPAIDRKIAPFLFILSPVPKIVFLPLLLILAGVGELSKALLLTIIAFFQLLIPIRDAAHGVNRDLVKSMVTLGANRWNLYRHVVFPSVLPTLFSALKMCIGLSIAILFLSETYATQYGIGYFVMDAIARFDYEEVFCGIIGMGGLGLLLFALLESIERRACHWRQA